MASLPFSQSTDAFVDPSDVRFVGKLEPQLREASRSDLDVLITGGSDRLRRLVARLVHYRSERGALPFVVLEPDYVSLPTRTWTLPQLPQAGSILLVEVAALSTENQFFLGQLLEQRARRRSRGDAQPRLFACAAQPVDVQATTGDLSTQLFYRLNALHLRLGTTLP